MVNEKEQRGGNEMGKIVSTLVVVVAGATQLIAGKGTPLRGQDTIKLVFTEKDHPKDEKADLKALFGDYGSALVIGIQLDGKVVTCDVRHEAHKQKPISSPTSVKMSDFKNENGQLSGKLTTDEKAEAFGETWEVNLTFRTKVP
ncbi:MAG: hypothetical protein DME42_08815 [Verrucomicrobia bacterium]|nr:MAG: hypothetical protein DME42_08815 [Verrucomicrobiota bacterium]